MKSIKNNFDPNNILNPEKFYKSFVEENMQEYNAPIEDILFVIENLSSDIKSTNEEYSDPDLLKQIFEEAGKFSL